jgi:O-antigen/teichoic acid export membrane protein
MMWSFLKEVTKHTTIYGMGGLATKLVGFVLLPLYTHYLTPADYGVLGLLYITMRVLDIVAIQGMTTAVFRAYTFEFKGETEQQREAVCTAYFYSIGSAVLLFGSLSLLSQPFNDIVFKDGDWTYLFRLMFLAGVFRSTQNVPRQIMRAHRRSALYSIIQFCDFVMAAGLNIYFIVFAGKGLAGIVYSEVIREGLLMIVFFFTIRPYLARRFSKQKLKEMLAFGLPKVPGGISFLVLSASDRYFLEHFSTATELGLYSIGYRLAGLLGDFAIQPFLQTWPTMYFPLAKESPDEGKGILGRFMTYFLVVVGFMALGICVFVEPLLRIMADPKFAGAVQVVPLVVLALVFSGVYRVLIVGINIRKKTIFIPMMVGGAAALNVFFNALLIPRWGMMGAAWATVFSYIAMCTAAYIIDHHFFPIQYERGRIVRVVIALASTFAISRVVTPDHLLGQVAAGLSMLLLYPATLGVLGFYTEAELDKLKSFVNRRIGPPKRKRRKHTDETSAGVAVDKADASSAPSGEIEDGEVVLADSGHDPRSPS